MTTPALFVGISKAQVAGVSAAEIVAMALNPDAFWKGSEGEMADARAQASEVAEILNYWLACKGLPPLEELTP